MKTKPLATLALFGTLLSPSAQGAAPADSISRRDQHDDKPADSKNILPLSVEANRVVRQLEIAASAPVPYDELPDPLPARRLLQAQADASWMKTLEMIGPDAAAKIVTEHCLKGESVPAVVGNRVVMAKLSDDATTIFMREIGESAYGPAGLNGSSDDQCALVGNSVRQRMLQAARRAADPSLPPLPLPPAPRQPPQDPAASERPPLPDPADQLPLAAAKQTDWEVRKQSLRHPEKANVFSEQGAEDKGLFTDAVETSGLVQRQCESGASFPTPLPDGRLGIAMVEGPTLKTRYLGQNDATGEETDISRSSPNSRVFCQQQGEAFTDFVARYQSERQGAKDAPDPTLLRRP